MSAPKAFAAMPFDAAFDDVYFVGMIPATRTLGLECVRVDQTFHGSDSVEEARRQIHSSVVVIADVTRAHPDVLYEIGFAHALNKPTIQICSTDYETLPFSIRNRDTLPYQPGRTHLLADRLHNYLARLLASSSQWGQVD